MSAGGYHHHLGDQHLGKPRRLAAGAGHHRPLPHRDPLPDPARCWPTRCARVIEAKIPLDGASDHGVSEALYLRDPDENGVELYWDRPKEQWPRNTDGAIDMFTRRLDLQDLLAELDKATA